MIDQKIERHTLKERGIDRDLIAPAPVSKLDSELNWEGVSKVACARYGYDGRFCGR